MNCPLRITFRNFESSDALAAAVEAEISHLERFYDRIISCHVMLELPHRHQRQGRHFHVRIELQVPGRELVVGRAPTAHAAFEDPYLAVSEAFRALRRQVQDYARMRRGDVKRPAQHPAA